jgi:hypothetical protein
MLVYLRVLDGKLSMEFSALGQKDFMIRPT